MEIEYKINANDIIIQVTVVPNSSQSCITGVNEGIIRLKLNSPPIDGRANKEVVAFFSKFFRIPKSAIKIIRGEKSKLKTLQLNGDTEMLQSKLKSFNI